MQSAHYPNQVAQLVAKLFLGGDSLFDLRFDRRAEALPQPMNRRLQRTFAQPELLSHFTLRVGR